MAELARDLVPFVPDPHHGSRLVERMSRTLRRSAGTWDGESTSSGRITGITPSDSGPSARLGSQPVMPWQSDPAMTYTPRPGALGIGRAPPLDSPITTMRTKRRAWPWLFVLAPAIGIGVALAFTMAGSDTPEEKSAAAPVESAPTPDPTKQIDKPKLDAVKPVEVAKPSDSKPAESKPGEAKTAAQTDPAPVEAKPAAAGTKPAVEPKKPKPQQTKAQTQIKKPITDPAPKPKLEDKTVKVDKTEKPKPPPPADLDCNPYHHMRGLPCACPNSDAQKCVK
jgi:hypothetical protein